MNLCFSKQLFELSGKKLEEEERANESNMEDRRGEKRIEEERKEVLYEYSKEIKVTLSM